MTDEENARPDDGQMTGGDGEADEVEGGSDESEDWDPFEENEVSEATGGDVEAMSPREFEEHVSKSLAEADDEVDPSMPAPLSDGEVEAALNPEPMADAVALQRAQEQIAENKRRADLAEARSFADAILAERARAAEAAADARRAARGEAPEPSGEVFDPNQLSSAQFSQLMDYVRDNGTSDGFVPDGFGAEPNIVNSMAERQAQEREAWLRQFDDD